MDRIEIKSLAKAKFRPHWGTILLILFLTIPATGIALILGFGVGELLIFGPLSFGLFYVCLQVINDEEADWKNLFIAFKTRFADSFFAGLLMCLFLGIPIVGAGIFFSISIAVRIRGAIDYYMGGGSAGYSFLAFLCVAVAIALIVAYVVLYCTYCQVFIILIKEPKTTAIKAMTKSRFMMRGKKLSFIIFMLSFIGWFLLGCVTFGIALIYVLPYYWTAVTIYLNRIYEKECNIDMTIDPSREKINSMKENIHDKVNNISNRAKEQVVEDELDIEDSEVPEQVEENELDIEDNVEQEQVEENELDIEDNVEQEPEQETEKEELRFCKYCGAALPEGAQFCGKCGRPQ